MAFEANLRLIPGLTAGQDFSGTNPGRFRFGVIGEGATVTLCQAAGRPNGVICDNPALGRRVEFAVGDVCQIIAGGPVTSGDLAACGADGVAIRQTSTAPVCGTFLSDGVAGDAVSVLIQLQGAP